jgi:hypothetical protein
MATVKVEVKVNVENNSGEKCCHVATLENWHPVSGLPVLALHPTVVHLCQ